MNSKKLISATMATALTLSLATGALAAGGTPPGYGGNKPGAGEIAKNGHTTISIMQAKENPQNVSFEVPLYITMAVVDNDAVVKVPDNYGIKNTSKDKDGNITNAYDIGVTAMYFEKLAGGTFNTVAAAPTAATEIQLSIGGTTMPALDTAKEERVTLAGDFLDAGKTKAIAPDAALNLLLAGAVTADTRTDVAAVAQFRVKYTISALNDAGDALGNVYAGDDSFAAGLGDQS